MAIVQALCNALDETVHALSILDLDTLEAIEQRMALLTHIRFPPDKDSVNAILAKKRVLEMVLHHSELNLNALCRLYGRNTRDLWER